MLSQLDFCSPEPHVKTSELTYAKLKYPVELNNPNPFQNPPLLGQTFHLSVWSHIIQKAKSCRWVFLCVTLLGFGVVQTMLSNLCHRLG